MAANQDEPPFACPKLPSAELQNLISKCNVITTNSFWLQYYLPQPTRIDSGIYVRLPSALSIQNASDHANSIIKTPRTEEKDANNTNNSHVRQQSTMATRRLESLKFELCLATNLANKPNFNKNNNQNNDKNDQNTSDTQNNQSNNATNPQNTSNNANYDDPFAGLSFENPNENVSVSQNSNENVSKNDKNGGKKDPFMGPFASGSHICDLGENNNNDYRLVLNKYPVWPNNILVVSKEYIDQSKVLLSEKEFDLGYKVLLSCIMDTNSKNNKINYDCPHLLFFNSGEHSGGTLTHRHFHLIYNLSHLPLNIIGAYLKSLKLEYETKKRALLAVNNPNLKNTDAVDAATLDAIATEAKTEEKKDEKTDDSGIVPAAIENVVNSDNEEEDGNSSVLESIYSENKDGITVFKEFGFVHGIILIDSKKWYDCGYNGKILKDMYDKLMTYVSEKVNGKVKGAVSYNLLLNNEMMMIIARSKDEFEGFKVNALPFAGLFFVSSESEMDMFKNSKDKSGKQCYDALKNVTFAL